MDNPKEFSPRDAELLLEEGRKAISEMIDSLQEARKILADVETKLRKIDEETAQKLEALEAEIESGLG